MKLWKATFAATLGVLLFGSALAQTKTPPPIDPNPVAAVIAPLTPEEKLAVREVEVLSLQLQAQMSALQARSKEVAQQFADASQAMDKALKAIYAKRKIDQADYQLCEQPGPGVCASAPAGDLTLQPVPKEGKK